MVNFHLYLIDIQLYSCQNLQDYQNLQHIFLYHSDYIRPYDNSRIGIDVEGDIIPVEATPAGFIIKNIKNTDLEYPILPYEDLENFDFYPDDTVQCQSQRSLTLGHSTVDVIKVNSDNLKIQLDDRF